MISLDPLFYPLAETSFRASLLIGPLILLRPWLRRVIGSRWLCVLWTVLLCRLLAPLPTESRWGLLDSWFGQAREPVAEKTETRIPSLLPLVKQGAAAGANEAVAMRTPGSGFDFGFAGTIWLAGMVLGLAGLGVKIGKARTLARQTSGEIDDRVRQLYESIPVEIRGGVALRLTHALDVPTLAGVFAPQIWLPQSWEKKLTPTELRHVLLHELGHARRHDLLVQWLFAIVQCVHWFNPFVWLLARCARGDREMACDAWVLTQAGLSDPSEYGRTLIRMAGVFAASPRTLSGGVAMASGKRNLAARVAGIAGFRPQPSWRGAIGVAIVLAGLAALSTKGMAEGKSARTGEKGGGAQVEIQARLIAVSRSALAELERAGKIFAKDSPFVVPGARAGKIDDVRAVLSPSEAEKMLRILNTTAKVDLVSAPRITLKPRQRGKMELVHAFKYPSHSSGETSGKQDPAAFQKKDLGVVFDVEPAIRSDGKTVDLRVNLQLTELSQSGDGGRKPSEPLFVESKIDTAVSLPAGQTAVLGGFQKPRGSLEKKIADDRILMLFITPRILDSPSP